MKRLLTFTLLILIIISILSGCSGIFSREGGYLMVSDNSQSSGEDFSITDAQATATPTLPVTLTSSSTQTPILTPTFTPTPHPLNVEAMRQAEYLGSEIVIEETLTPGYNYDQFIASYTSEGLKIYALLTIPRGTVPEGGFPAIIFNHGYIPPNEYRTTERYVAYVDRLARQGYVIFRPDYRGHGFSEGHASGAYWSPDYTIDVLNALYSVSRYPNVNPDRIGMWGHSMGGHITLRSMVTTDIVKVGVIWAGVAVSYPDMMDLWHVRTPEPGATTPPRSRWSSRYYSMYGDPEENPEFWQSISPNAYLEDVSGPIQLHHGTADETVPLIFSEILYDELQEAGVYTELYTYPGDNHNIARNFTIAMERTIDFFNTYLKE